MWKWRPGPATGEAGEGDGCEAGSLGNNINPGRGERKVLGTHSGQGPGCHFIQVREQQPVIQSKWWLNKYIATLFDNI